MKGDTRSLADVFNNLEGRNFEPMGPKKQAREQWLASISAELKTPLAFGDRIVMATPGDHVLRKSIVGRFIPVDDSHNKEQASARQRNMKKFTRGDECAIMILAAQRMGLEPRNVDDAQRQLEGGAIHPMVSAAMDSEAADANNRLRHDVGLIAKANVYAEHIKAEYGFIVDISKEAFLALQHEGEELEMAHARGQNLPEHTSRLKVIDKIMSACQWTLHPDYGCILKSEVNERDLAAEQQIPNTP